MSSAENTQPDPFDHSAILQEMVSGYALHEVITDRHGLVVDYRFLDINPAFERITGLRRDNVLGQTARTIMPETEDVWIKRYGKVALTGQPDTFESYAVELDKHFRVSAFCPKLGQFAVTFIDISDQKKNEEKLKRQTRLARRAEAELSAIYQNSPLAMVLLNADRKAVKLNLSALQLSGLSEEEALGRRPGELFNCVHAETGCGLGPECETCLAKNSVVETLLDGSTHRGVNATLVLNSADGAVRRHLSLSSAPVVYDGQRLALLCVDDLSPFVEEQQLHLESEERYRTLVDEGLDGVFIHKDMTIVTVNQRFAAILGTDREEPVGRSALDFIAPNYREFIRHRVATKAKGTHEIDMLHTEGHLVRVEIFAAQCTYQGEEARIVAIRDISERRRAEEEIRTSETRLGQLYQQFESLLDAIADPLCLIGPNDELLWRNQAYRTLQRDLDCDEGGLVFKRFFEDQSAYPVHKCFRTGERLEEEIFTQDGRSWLFRAFPLPGTSGEVEQVIVVSIDISEKKRLQEDAIRSSRMASLGVLAAGIAHEINNPNAVVLYNSDILLNIFQSLLPYLSDSMKDAGEVEFNGLTWEEVEQELPGLLTAMKGGAKRIKRIVDDLRDFARHDRKQEFASIDVNRVARTAVRLVENTLKKSTDHFLMELSDNLPRIKGDAGRLEQVVVNLLINACQALQNRGQAICLKTDFFPDSQCLVLQVVDEGQGIDPEILNTITEPFMTTKREKGGTGLGLSVTDRIIKEHGGRLLFESEPHKGTSVFMVLPVTEEGDG